MKMNVMLAVALVAIGAASCAFGAVLVNLLVSIFSGVRYFGLTGFYPMLRENMLLHPIFTLIFFVLLPAFLEEGLLRGPVFSMCEKEGTAAAVFFGTTRLIDNELFEVGR